MIENTHEYKFFKTTKNYDVFVLANGQDMNKRYEPKGVYNTSKPLIVAVRQEAT